jgi:hypothetical protein
MNHITVIVDNKWKPRVCEICKVFSHSCKAIVKAPTLSVEDMIKIKKKKGMLFKIVAYQLSLLIGLNPF